MGFLLDILVISATAMLTLDPASRGVHIMDFWSLEMAKNPCFFLYAADPLILDAALEGAIVGIDVCPHPDPALEQGSRDTSKTLRAK